MTLQKSVVLVALCAVTACVGSTRAQEAPLVAPLDLATGDSPAWGAGSPDEEHQRDGKVSRLWEHGKADSIAINTVPEDWSAYDHLTFWLYSRQATGAKFMMILSSENPATEGTDYYSAPITVNFTGWKRFRSALANLGASREPLGWKKIGGVLFTATGWGNQPNPQTVIFIGPVVLSQEGKTKGPRLSDAERAHDGKPHRYRALFHFDGSAKADANARRVATTNEGEPNLSIVARPDAGLKLQIIQGQENPVQGWLPNSNISSVRPAPVAVFESEGAGDTHFIWVRVPWRAGAPDPVVSVEAVPGKPLAARIRFGDGRVHDVAFSGGEDGQSRAVLSETLPDGKPGRTIAAAPQATAK